MAFGLNDIILRSEKKSREQLLSKQFPKYASEQKVEINVVTVEDQQRKAEAISKSVAVDEVPIPAPRRSYQVKTRFSEEEKRFFDQRVKASGMAQGEFMRQVLLHESVEVRSVTAVDAEALETLSCIASELGRIGGMLRGTVIRNKGEFGVLSPHEKADLEWHIREVNRIKVDIQKAVQSIYGDH